MNRRSVLAACLLICLVMCANRATAGPWKPVEGQLLTRWSTQIDPAHPLPEYPRPQLVRANWRNLNGLWQYAICPKEREQPDAFDGEILVPFPVESALSGVKRPVQPAQRLWYRRTFRLSDLKRNHRMLLHFGAVDWEATVWLNGQLLGSHRGGYAPFSFDITDQLRAEGDQELVLAVWDPTDQGYQPRGKQVLHPRGIWYTAVTGIWRTVWLEEVPEHFIRNVTMTPDMDAGQVHVIVSVNRHSDDIVACVEVGAVSCRAKTLKIKPISKCGTVGKEIAIAIPQTRLWSPDEPWLYRAAVSLRKKGQLVDRVITYFGMRKIEVAKDDKGVPRLMLNHEQLFQIGPLDQGWWPDGLYRAPTDDALRYDLEITKKLGFNMIRKHVKVEPARWYYHCDRLGLMVWQDMPNGDKHIGKDEPDLTRSAESAANYRQEFKAVIESLRNHPCIVAWVPFNEGWGQFETKNILQWTKQLDPTRLVDGPSGWTDRHVGDMHDIHRYPGPAIPQFEADRAIVLGEFGGLGLPIQGHLWRDRDNWGYRNYGSRKQLQQNYELLIRKLHPMIGQGLSAAVYTQTTDVEGEVNGLMTYDREVIKQDPKHLASLHKRLHLPPPVVKRTIVVPTSERHPQTWRYTTKKPASTWSQPDFDDRSWQSGPGGFGTKDTPGAIVGSSWKTSDIWLRRTFKFSGHETDGLHLRIHHDEDAEVYLNGIKIAERQRFVGNYEDIPLTNAAKHLRQGTCTLAVHCRQTRGGQFIDVGLVFLKEMPPKKD